MKKRSAKRKTKRRRPKRTTFRKILSALKRNESKCLDNNSERIKVARSVAKALGAPLGSRR